MTKLRSHIKVVVYIVITKFMWNIRVGYFRAPNLRWGGDGIAGNSGMDGVGMTNETLDGYSLLRRVRGRDDFPTKKIGVGVVHGSKKGWGIKGLGVRKVGGGGRASGGGAVLSQFLVVLLAKFSDVK